MLAPLGMKGSWNPTSKPVDPTKVCVNCQRGEEQLVSISRFLALEQASPTQMDTEARVAVGAAPGGRCSWWSGWALLPVGAAPGWALLRGGHEAAGAAQRGFPDSRPLCASKGKTSGTQQLSR